jgi:CDP-paratose 2-epimerase
LPGVSTNGITEEFPLKGSRTLYGTTKLAAELLIAEYREIYNLRTVINRCGVIAGPWQMGVADQGIFTYWILSHLLNRPLRYVGYGGLGKQVRDILHVEDLARLVEKQIANPDHWNGHTFNVGGGQNISLSLLEATNFCREIGYEVPVESTNETRAGDVRIYLSDCARLFSHTAWRPEHSAEKILEDIFDWCGANLNTLELAF